MPDITSSTLLVRNPAIFASQVDNELVMMDEAQGRYYGLNSIGSEIWSLLESSLSFEGLIQKLSQTHDVSEGQCREQVTAFLAQMIDNGLVRTH